MKKFENYLVQIRPKSYWPSELELTIFFANTKAQPLISLGATPSNINSTVIV